MSDLGDLGLSGYEERAYRALLALGAATASEVAASSDVPKGRIYDVLNGLAARDVVDVRSGGEARTYVPVDPDEAVDRLLAERKRELDRERDRYEDLAEAVSEELARTVPVEGQFWEIGMGSDDAVAGMREQFDRADDHLLSVVGPPYDATPFDAYRPEVDAYADLVDTDVEVKLLTTPDVLSKQPPEQLTTALADASEFAVRTTPDVRLTFDVVDGEQVYLSVPAPFTPAERAGAVVVRDADLAGSMADRFRTAWADARAVDPTPSDD